MAKKHRTESTKIPLEEPTVIVEMSFTEKYLPLIYSKHVQIGIFVVVVLALIAFGSFWYLGFRTDVRAATQRTAEAAAAPREIVITVVAEPSDATIHIDGKAMEKNPLTLEVTASSTHHTIVAKAQGHETLERDARFNETQTIRLKLPEIIAPEGSGIDTMAEEDPAGAIQEVITD